MVESNSSRKTSGAGALGTEDSGRNPMVYYSGDINSVDWAPTGIRLIECLRTFVLTEISFASNVSIS